MKRILCATTAIALATVAFVPVQATAQPVNVSIAVGTPPPAVVVANPAPVIVIDNPPPPPRYEPVPVARPGFVWVAGFWDWNPRRNKHKWVKGHWESARAGHYYARPEWRQGPRGWELNRGGWHSGPAPVAHRGHDRDHDGVPDRFDNYPNNPNRR